jgi:deferrochelatase/peroxidase EfeB
MTPGGSMADVQPGILAPLPRLGRYLIFSLKAGAEPRQALLKLIDVANAIKPSSASASRRFWRWEKPSED